MRVKNIIETIEEFAPKKIAESWDNVGLMVGSPTCEVSSVFLSLDVTEEVVDEAIAIGAEMIVSHHPLIFEPLKNIAICEESTDVQRAVTKAIKNDVAIYSAHTNADSAFGGVSQILAEKLGIRVTGTMVQNPNFESSDTFVGLGAVGELGEPMETLELLQKVKERLNLKHIRYSKPHKSKVQRIALCGGSGASLIARAKELKADLYLTGDLKYHDYFAPESGITIADIGHYESEIAILDKFEEVLKKAQQLKGVIIHRVKNSGNPIYTL